ncbi:MAG TPA: hypothetical protein VFK10_16470 [Burkholderiaceae bacterium]|nr:hypothetical protein [Burkholderiaceae bacterium]
MSARSTLSTLAALALLACGSATAGETFDSQPGLAGWIARLNKPLSLSQALRSDAPWLRSIGHDSIEPGLSAASVARAPFAAASLEGSDSLRPGTRLSFSRESDDVRAGSSASISLGRLNLNETRGSPALGGAPSQSDLDRELAQLRESINRVRLTPQVSLGMRVKF